MKTITETTEQNKVKLIKGQRDTYGWEITVCLENLSKAVEVLEAIDGQLRSRWGNGLTTVEEEARK